MHIAVRGERGRRHEQVQRPAHGRRQCDRRPEEGRREERAHALVPRCRAGGGGEAGLEERSAGLEWTPRHRPRERLERAVGLGVGADGRAQEGEVEVVGADNRGGGGGVGSDEAVVPQARDLADDVEREVGVAREEVVCAGVSRARAKRERERRKRGGDKEKGSVGPLTKSRSRRPLVAP